MNKIHSYISSLFLDEILKYVKVNANDLQISIWDGEIALQNLELQTDVVEEKFKNLHIPLHVISGHLQELIIRIPWSTILSEPIHVIIKTVELIVHLHDYRKFRNDFLELEKKKLIKIDNKRTTTTNNQNESGKGGKVTYSIVNSIINNVRIDIENIIIKYFQPKVSISINIVHFGVSTANDKWEIATNIEPFSIIQRKSIIISGFVLCLDKTNDKNEIEFCQEPIVKKCSFEIRAIKQDISLTSSQLRIDIFTQDLIFNISSLQSDLIASLLDWMNYFKISSSSSVMDLLNIKSQDNDTTTGTIQKNEQLPSIASATDGGGNSYLPWAINWISSYFIDSQVTKIETETLSSSSSSSNRSNNRQELIEGHIINFGIYFKELKLILKLSKINTNNHNRILNIRNNPLLNTSLKNLFCETVVSDNKWSNTIAGLSSISIESFGNDYASNIKQNPIMIIRMNNISKNDNNSKSTNQNWLYGSLFNVIDNKITEKIRLPALDLQNHLKKINDDYMWNRGPMFSIDSVICRDNFSNENKPSDNSCKHSSVSLQMHEVDKYFLVRLFLKDMVINLNANLNEFCDQILGFIKPVKTKYESKLKNETKTNTSNEYSEMDLPKLNKTIEINCKGLRIEFL